MKMLGGTKLAMTLVAVVAALSLVGTACGSSDDPSTAETTTDASSDAQEADGTGDEAQNTTADEATDDQAADTEADLGGDEPGRTTGRFFPGEAYDDGEFRATYRGLAQIPVGPDIFEGGSCYAALFDVTFLDPLDFGSDEFRPSLDAYLDDGTTATGDQTGVGCDATVLEPEGYVWLNDTTIEAGQTATGYLTPFHVASGIVTDIDIITIYGALPTDGGFDPIVTAELRSPAS